MQNTTTTFQWNFDSQRFLYTCNGIEKIRNGEADMINFGRLYISNPDLAERIIKECPVN